MEGDHSNGISLENRIANAAAMVAPSVVHIIVTGTFNASNNNAGSGTLIDANGTILTCAHILASISSTQIPIWKGKIEVILQDGTRLSAIVGDIDIYADIALLKVNCHRPLPTAKLGISAKLRPGDSIIALGSPKFLPNSVTSGIISCVDRKGSTANLPVAEGKYLQVDCSINEGNSGGPLVNIDGEVVGVVLLSMKNAVGLHFAMPIDSISEIMKYFEKHRIMDCPWIGAKIISKFQEGDSSISKGISVLLVESNSPVVQAGIRRLDVIVELDGEPVLGAKEFNELIQNKVGKNVRVGFERADVGMLYVNMVPLRVYVA